MIKYDKNVNLQRRKFLDMVAKSGVSTGLMKASPFVGGMMASRFASAQEDANKRVIFLSFPGGAPSGSWMPSSSSRMNSCTEAYGAVASYCNFYSVNVPGGGHGMSHASLGGRQNTMDTQLADVLGANTPYSAVNLSVEVGTSNDLIGRRNGQVVKPEESPDRAFSQLFSAPPPGAAAEALYNRQKTALDINKDAISALKGKLNSEERQRMDIHLAAMERIDKRLKAASAFVPPEGCDNPDMPSSGESASGIVKDLMIQTDIAIAALQCGMTNVVTIQLDDSQCEWRYNGSFTEGHHQTCHGRSRADVVEIMKYLGQAGAYVIQRLVDTPDPNGDRLIDSTVFMQVSEMGDGMTHVQNGAPYILATNMSGFRKGTTGGGGSNTGLLGDLAQGLGLGSSVSIGSITDHKSDYSALV